MPERGIERIRLLPIDTQPPLLERGRERFHFRRALIFGLSAFAITFAGLSVLALTVGQTEIAAAATLPGFLIGLGVGMWSGYPKKR